MTRTRVLIVDDSAHTRQVLKRIIEQDDNLEVAGVAINGVEAIAKTMAMKPDIITLDFEMPDMDGFSFLRWLMKERPTPVIMVSSFSDSRTVFKALELGAVDFIAKPTRRASVELESIEKDMLRKLKGIKEIRLDKLSKNLDMLETEEKPAAPKEQTDQNIKIVAIGSSTGGPAALQIIFTRLPVNFSPAVVVSQHMPRGFTAPLAERLNRMSHITIAEAKDGDRIESGLALICPGGFHMNLKKKGRDTLVELKEGKITDRYIPSVDQMMVSVAHHFGQSSMGVILTGMGNDGKAGMVEIKAKGGYTIAESEETAVVFGMPGEAIKANGVISVVPLPRIPSEMVKVINSPRARDKR